MGRNRPSFASWLLPDVAGKKFESHSYLSPTAVELAGVRRDKSAQRRAECAGDLVRRHRSSGLVALRRPHQHADHGPARKKRPDLQSMAHDIGVLLRPENGTFETENYTDTYAREKWFYQAQVESPAMFSRAPGAGSLYWLGLRDKRGVYLDGGGSYKLVVPQPVPAKSFWSVTVYDALTRSEIATDQNCAALRSMFELKGLETESTAELFFGPKAPPAKRSGGSKPSRVGVGLCIFASMARNNPRSTAHGNQATSKR
jgi:Protein of unknown function (DUF1214)